MLAPCCVSKWIKSDTNNSASSRQIIEITIKEVGNWIKGGSRGEAPYSNQTVSCRFSYVWFEIDQYIDPYADRNLSEEPEQQLRTAYAGHNPVNNVDPGGHAYDGIHAAQWAKETAAAGNSIPGFPWPSWLSSSKCTHFVSTAMYLGGGVPMKDFGRHRTNKKSWWYYNEERRGHRDQHWSYTWGASENLYQHLMVEGEPYATRKNRVGQLVKGDLIFIAKHGPGSKGHVEMVTGKEGSDTLISQQGAARSNYSWRRQKRKWLEDYPNAEFYYVRVR